SSPPAMWGASCLPEGSAAEFDDLIDNGGSLLLRCIDAHRVLRRAQGRNAPARILLVPGGERCRHFVQGDFESFRPKLVEPPLRPFFRTGVEEDLQIGVREDHSPDV